MKYLSLTASLIPVIALCFINFKYIGAGEIPFKYIDPIYFLFVVWVTWTPFYFAFIYYIKRDYDFFQLLIIFLMIFALTSNSVLYVQPMTDQQTILNLNETQSIYVKETLQSAHKIDLYLETKPQKIPELNIVHKLSLSNPVLTEPIKDKFIGSYDCSKNYKNLRECIEGVKKTLSESNTSLDQLLNSETQVAKK